MIPNYPHHVTQRGNHRRTVFFTDSDRELYLKLLYKHFSRWEIQMPGYSLMTNHTHQLLIPATPHSLARGVGRLHNDYARLQHMQQNLTGHLWQNRFFSCPLDDEHFWEALRYIELNPVRVGLVKNAWDWPWSSARAHVNEVDDTGLLNMDIWKMHFNGRQWRLFLEDGLKKSRIINNLRLATRTGRPLGSEDFVLQLEAITGRRLRPKKPGPKRGSVSAKRKNSVIK